jgi:hypothetical protein
MFLIQSHETLVYWEIMVIFMCEQILKIIQSVVPRGEFVSLNSNMWLLLITSLVYQSMYMWCEHGEEC